MTRGSAVVDREGMDEILADVQSGAFAREWITENEANRPAYRQHRRAEQTPQIEQVGDRLRDLFAWDDTDTEERA